MATEIQKSPRSIRSEEELKEHEKKLYVLLRHEVGLHRDVLKAYGIDHRIFHYYLRGGGPAWSPKKEEFVRRLIKIVEEEYPSLWEIREELESYLSIIRKFRNERARDR